MIWVNIKASEPNTKHSRYLTDAKTESHSFILLFMVKFGCHLNKQPLSSTIRSHRVVCSPAPFPPGENLAKEM
jgi:hypothetical protein